MLNIMREGGFNMWVLLVIAIGTTALALARKGGDRGRVLVAGALAALASGMLGMATGLMAVSRNYQRFPDPVAALGEGLGELSHNGTVGALVAAVLGAWAIASLRAPKAA